MPSCLQVVGDALRGVGHLGGLVTRAVKPDDQSKAGQLIAAYPFNGGDFFDAAGVGHYLPSQAANASTAPP
jgi:hypothetical protein